MAQATILCLFPLPLPRPVRYCRCWPGLLRWSENRVFYSKLRLQCLLGPDLRHSSLQASRFRALSLQASSRFKPLKSSSVKTSTPRLKRLDTATLADCPKLKIASEARLALALRDSRQPVEPKVQDASSLKMLRTSRLFELQDASRYKIPLKLKTPRPQWEIVSKAPKFFKLQDASRLQDTSRHLKTCLRTSRYSKISVGSYSRRLKTPQDASSLQVQDLSGTLRNIQDVSRPDSKLHQDV
ncbi:hypothetical protein K438DRAFT_2108152 [Mycena galopus ATCC 62051]|nr:hypothetical protein K438DRAFT_2108152 [Mycena galopus ATCC 62051]